MNARSILVWAYWFVLWAISVLSAAFIATQHSDSSNICTAVFAICSVIAGANIYYLDYLWEVEPLEREVTKLKDGDGVWVLVKTIVMYGGIGCLWAFYIIIWPLVTGFLIFENLRDGRIPPRKVS